MNKKETEVMDKIEHFLRSMGIGFVDHNVTIYDGSLKLLVDMIGYLDSERNHPIVLIEIDAHLYEKPDSLDSSFQRAYAASWAIEELQYVLITNGNEMYWYEKSLNSKSLIYLNKVPEVGSHSHKTNNRSESLIYLSDEQFIELIKKAISYYRFQSFSLNIETIVEINKLIIAKLAHDLSDINNKKTYAVAGNHYETLKSINYLLPHDLRIPDIYSYENRQDDITPLMNFVALLQKYSLVSVSREVVGSIYWEIFVPLLKHSEYGYATPLSLANLAVEFSGISDNQVILDPACGSGAMLVESGKSFRDRFKKELYTTKLCGFEVHSDSLELAKTNLALAGLDYREIIKNDFLSIENMENKFDVILLDPPIGSFDDKKRGEIKYNPFIRTLEAAFIFQSFQLLKAGGKLVCLVPDGLLSSPRLQSFREWLLINAKIEAIIKLPMAAFTDVGHSGKASLLVIEKPLSEIIDYSVFVAEIDDFQPTREKEKFRQSIRDVKIMHDHFLRKEFEVIEDLSHKFGLFAHVVPSDTLSKDRLDVPSLEIYGLRGKWNPRSSGYPTFNLSELCEIIGGKDVKWDKTDLDGEAIFLQAGSVRELSIDWDRAPRISHILLKAAQKAEIKLSDVLITSTGQYLGRAAVVDYLPMPSVASSSIMILRPKGIDPYYLAAYFNSDAGQEQIKRFKSSSGVLPFLRLRDVARVIVPIPSQSKQSEIGVKIRRDKEIVAYLQKQAEDLDIAMKRGFLQEIFLKGDYE